MNRRNLLAAFGGIGGSSAIAADRDIQAINAKQGCVAGSIRQADLSPSISVMLAMSIPRTW